MRVLYDNLVIRGMADILLEQVKEAREAPQQPGKMQKYLPWYGAAGIGMAGHETGKLLPKKYQMLGRIGGTLAGTALGVHGGETVGRKLDQRKTAAIEEKKPKHPASTLGKSMLGFGLGTAGGYVGMKGLDALMRARGGTGLSQHAALAVPVLTGLGGLAYANMQKKTLGKMREDHLKRQEMKRGSQST